LASIKAIRAFGMSLALLARRSFYHSFSTDVFDAETECEEATRLPSETVLLTTLPAEATAAREAGSDKSPAPG
jgi:hypothetical protein